MNTLEVVFLHNVIISSHDVVESLFVRFVQHSPLRLGTVIRRNRPSFHLDQSFREEMEEIPIIEL